MEPHSSVFRVWNELQFGASPDAHLRNAKKSKEARAAVADLVRNKEQYFEPILVLATSFGIKSPFSIDEIRAWDVLVLEVINAASTGADSISQFDEFVSHFSVFWSEFVIRQFSRRDVVLGFQDVAIHAFNEPPRFELELKGFLAGFYFNPRLEIVRHAKQVWENDDYLSDFLEARLMLALKMDF